MLSSKIAVLLHLFYTDMWVDVKEYLKNLNDHEYDLYVNLVDGHYENSIIDEIRNFKNNAVVINSPNKGVDIGGFLYLYKIIDTDYDLVLKLHTKKSLGLPEKPSDYVKVYGYDSAVEKGNQWFHRLMGGVLDSKQQVNDIIQLLQDDENIFMMAGLDREIYVGPNKGLLQNLSEVFSIPVEFEKDNLKKMCFVGGTIFWVRNNLLKKYLTKDKIDLLLKLLPEGYQNEPSYNHASERLFGMMVYNENKKIINL